MYSGIIITNDEINIEKIRFGDLEEFTRLFKQFYEPLYFFAGRFVWDKASAENIVQDFFVKLWERRDSLEITTSLKSYMYTSIKNLSLNFIKKENHFSAIEEEETVLENQKNPVEILEENELGESIHKAISELPDKCREIFMMCRFDDLSYQEIAEIQNISVNTVKTQLQRAMKILSNKLSHIKFILFTIALIILESLKK